MKESALKKKIRKDLPADAWKFSPVQTGMGVSGIPDILVCIPTVIKQEDVGKTFGLFVGIEAKVGYNKPNPRQLLQLREIDKAGGVALVVTGKDKQPYKTERIKNKPLTP